MSKTLDRDLEAAKSNLRRMVSLVEESVKGGAAALRDRDAKAAEAVLAGDDAIDELENYLAEQCHRILALHQPMASPLRHVVATMQVSTELERIGDLARSIAERANELLHSPFDFIPHQLTQMIERVLKMVHGGFIAFVEENPGLAREVRDCDNAVDEDRSTIIRELIDGMKRAPHFVEPALSVFSAVRSLERIADHATNVAEQTVFLVEGQSLRHKHSFDSPVHRPGAALSQHQVKYA